MDRELHKQSAAELPKTIEATFPADRHKELDGGLYTFNELGLWGCDIELRPAEALRIWALVEYIRQNGFPSALCM